MKNEGRGKEFPIAQKIYGALLRAYPPAHRAEYGPAMAQLFRDQCRDAWGESKHFGLLKLWLRVLPDWAKTSIMERLAALNERKTMNEKLANLSSFQTPPGKVFTRVFVVVFLMVFLASVAIAFLLPDSYASSATMKVENDQPAAINQTYDPYFIQTQFEIIQSDLVLSDVITALNLNEMWGKKYFNGKMLKSSETLEILKGRMGLAPVKNTKLVRVTVYSDDGVEAAEIANAITKSYHNYRKHIFVEAKTIELERLQQQYQNEAEQIQKSQVELESSHQDGTVTASILKTKERELSQIVELHKLHYAKLAAAKIDVAIPLLESVQIIDLAEPGKAPVKPNKTLNIVLGAFFGILLAGAFGGAAFFITKLRRRNRAPEALAGN